MEVTNNLPVSLFFIFIFNMLQYFWYSLLSSEGMFSGQNDNSDMLFTKANMWKMDVTEQSGET